MSSENTQSLATLSATLRQGAGKGAARRLRASGKVPAIAYGKDFPATALSVTPKDVITVLKSTHGKNSVLKLDYGQGKDTLVMIRDYSYHPVSRALEHVDFVEVRLDRPVDVDIPLIPTGKAAGLAEGGILRQVYRALPVRCLPDRIPVKIEIDVTPLKLGETIATKALALMEGVTVLLAPEQTLIAVVAPEVEKVSEEEAAAASVAAAAATAGAAATPAAAGAAPGAKPEAAKDAKAAAPAKDDKKKK